MRKKTIVITFLLATSICSFGQEYDENNDGKTDKWVEYGAHDRKTVRIDRNFNGNADYLVIYDRDGNLLEEHMDYNNDGTMDDFYYYSNNVLVRREVDSNYDGSIDIRVYIREGVYIEKYEVDSDFDGIMDKIKEY